MSQRRAGERRSRSPRRKPQELGKRELLAWAQRVSARRCESLEDLRDGVVLALVFAETFPAVVSRAQAVQNFRRYAATLKAMGAEAIILGCT